MSLSRFPDGLMGKALAILIGLAVLIVAQFAVISPLLTYYAATAQTLQDRWDAVERSRNAVLDLPQLKTTAEALRKKTDNHDLLLQGASDAIAAANLQSSLKDMIEQEGSKLVSAQTLVPVTQDRFQRIGLRASFSANQTQLTTILLAIESAHPILGIGNLDLHSSGEDEDPELTVSMDVYGFRAQ